jgi:hypothetical protein
MSFVNKITNKITNKIKNRIPDKIKSWFDYLFRVRAKQKDIKFTDCQEDAGKILQEILKGAAQDKKSIEGKEDIAENLADNPFASITFSILEDNIVHINCTWADEMIAPAYGEMLYRINSGGFAQEIIEILMEHAQNTPQDVMVVRDIISFWQMLQTNEDNQPLISPSNVFATEQSPHMHDME